MSAILPKKVCVGREDAEGSSSGNGASENALGFKSVQRKHQRVIPQQQDISAAVMRPLNDGDLRAANHTA